MLERILKEKRTVTLKNGESVIEITKDMVKNSINVKFQMPTQLIGVGQINEIIELLMETKEELSNGFKRKNQTAQPTSEHDSAS